ncbi:MAG: serine/threonine protein kinase [Pirellulaceae bacterium]|nr:serine/threonine protein kinase [Pirellulaceae bacterium]
MALDNLGPYRLEKLLGRGGMGTVYVGVDRTSGQRVAVKVLSTGFAGDRNFRDRFVTEIETLKQLSHPHIVEMYGYGEEDGNLFYSMELVAGRSLQEELQAGRRFPWREVARIGVQICHALKHAHDRGIVHRDLKPANLLLTEDDRIKLLDFGIAKLFGSTQMTVAGGVIGTADYMAPEQAAGRPVTSRSDLYSLGSVLYCLLAGRPPFHSKSLPEVIHALRYEAPRPIRRLVPEVPLEFEEILNQLLEKEPEQRIATALSLGHRLQAMERALSLDTQVAQDAAGNPLTVSSPEPPKAKSEGTKLPGPQEITHLPTSARPTADMGAATDLEHAEYRLADLPEETLVSEVYGAASATSQVPAAPTTHFTTVAAERERRRRQDRHSPDHDGPPWLKPLVTAAMLAIIVALVAGAWFATRPSSADQLFARLQQAADEGDPQLLSDLDNEMAQFRELYPDDERSGQVALWQQDLAAYRLQRRLERRARRVGGDSLLAPVEQAYLRAMRTKRSDYERARQEFAFLLDVFGPAADPDSDEWECVEMARHELSRMAAPAEKSTADLSSQLAARLAWAEQHLDQAQLRDFQRGVIGLFADQPWASETVERCRQALRE